MMTIKYLAEMQWGKPKLMKLEIEKETPKTITISEVTAVLGWSHNVWIGKRHSKPDGKGTLLTDDINEAFNWLIAKQQEHIRDLTENLDQAKIDEVQLIDLAEAARRGVEKESHVQQIS